MDKTTTINIVKEILENDEKARKDDFYLILRVIQKTNPEVRNMNFNILLENAELLHIPSFASITRARRNVTTKYPELIDEETNRIRRREEQKYKEEFSRKKKEWGYSKYEEKKEIYRYILLWRF